MSTLCTTGIITRCVNYRDSDKILTIFSAEHGRIDAKARGCRRQKSPLLCATQPFVYGEFELFLYQDKFTLNQCDVREPFFPLCEDITRFAAGACLLAWIQDAVQPGEPNAPLFSLLFQSLYDLTYKPCDPMDVTICFLLRYMNILGYCPAIIQCASCGCDLRTHKRIAFSPAHGGAVCQACNGSNARLISPLALEAMRRMLLLRDDQMDRVRLPQHIRKELFAHLEGYCSYVLERAYQPVMYFKKLYFNG